MISVGNRVIVLTSSTSKKGANIRRGSIGYINSISATYCKLSKGFISTPAVVTFVRFGYEKKRRIESKAVMLIHPYVSTHKIKNVAKALKSIILISNSLSKTNNIMFENQQFGIKNVKKIPSVVVRNTMSNINLEKNDLEFKAWLYSIMTSNLMNKFNVVNADDPLTKLKNETFTKIPGLLECLNKCRKYKMEAIKFADEMMSDKEHRRELILSLKRILCLENMMETDRHIKIISGENHFISGNTIIKSLIFLYSNRLMNKELYSKFGIITNNISIKRNIKEWPYLLESITL